MKLSGLILLLCLSGLFVCLGCSKEEQPPPTPKPKVVKKTITKAPVESARPAEPPVEEKARPEEKPKPEPPLKAEEKPRPELVVKAPEKPQPLVTAKTEEKPKPEVQVRPPEKPKPEVQAKAEEKPGPQPPAKPEKKEMRAEAPTKAAQVQLQERVPRAEDEKGYYVVKKGDTLASVSGQTDVYRDPLKWPILYRTNLDVLGSVAPAENMPDLELPIGIRLKILSEEEMKKNVEKRAARVWVVNALSAVTQAEVVPAVISLVKHNYPVYITVAKVNDKDWMRLRVGFFKTKAEADDEGMRIMELLHFKDSWTTKLGTNEFSDVARY